MLNGYDSDNKRQQWENYVNKETVKLFIRYGTWAAGAYIHKKSGAGWVSMHLQSINPSADLVLVKQTYEPHELYVCSSMAYKRVIKWKKEQSLELALHFGELL